MELRGVDEILAIWRGRQVCGAASRRKFLARDGLTVYTAAVLAGKFYKKLREKCDEVQGD